MSWAAPSIGWRFTSIGTLAKSRSRPIRSNAHATGSSPPHPPQQHPLLGRRVESPLPDRQHETVLSPRSWKALAEHRVNGKVVLPGTAYLALAYEIANSRRHPLILEDVAFERAMIFDGEEERLVQTVMTPTETGEHWHVKVYSRSLAASTAKSWMRHFSGNL